MSEMLGAEAKTNPFEPNQPAPQADLLLAYVGKLPAQLEHWLNKHGMRLERSDAAAPEIEDLKRRGARYVLIDIDSIPRNPVDVVREIRAGAPEARIIIVSYRSDETFIRGMTQAGVNAIVTKQPYVADLALALAATAGGESFVSGMARRSSVEATPREHEVLELMASGFSTREIGERLEISVKTVEAHRGRLFKKLGASNVADAVVLAIRAGLVTP